MAQIIDLHRLFVSIDAPLGVRERWLVDTSVADQSIEGFGLSKVVEFSAKVADGIKAGKFALHGSKGGLVKAVDFGHGFHLAQIPHGAHHMVLSGPQQGRGCFAAQTRRCSRYYH